MAIPSVVMPHVYTGGIIYTLCFTATVAAIIATDTPATDNVLVSHVPQVLITTCCVCIWSAIVFRFSMSPSHKNMFFRVETHKRLRELDWSHWMQVNLDKTAKSIFRGCRMRYTRDEDVREMLRLNWDRWQEDRPTWFTQQYIDSIPPHLLPVPVSDPPSADETGQSPTGPPLHPRGAN